MKFWTVGRLGGEGKGRRGVAVPAGPGTKYGMVLRSLAWTAGAGAAAMVAAILLLGLMTPQYTAVLVVGPTARTGAAAIGMRLPDLNRETTAAVAEPGAADEVLSDFSRYLALLRSLPVARQMMQSPDTLPAMFPERWDPVHQRWHTAGGVWATIKRTIIGLTGRDTAQEPDAVEVSEALERRVSIASVGTGPIRRISFRHPDRAFALAFLQRLSVTAEQQLRQEAMRRAQVQIDLVKQRWDSLRADDHRAALRGLMAEQERLLMVLGADLPYAADIIEPVHAATLPDWPDALLVVAVSGLSAMVLVVWLIGWRRFGWFAGATAP